MALKILTPAEIWRDFIEGTDVIVTSERVTILEDFIAEHRLTYISESRDDGEIVVSIRCLVPDNPVGAVLLVEDYEKPYNKSAVTELLSSGFLVAIPDYCNRNNEGTAFTPSTSYLDIASRGDRLSYVVESAMDSCQVFYARILRRAITLILRHFGQDKVFIASLGDSAEIAIMTAATDSRVCGQVLINGYGYSEYNDLNMYGVDNEPVLDEQLMCWMTGVASVAYAQYVKSPTLIAIGSNSARCDIDRLSDFIALMARSKVNVCCTTGARDTLGRAVFKTIKSWLSHVIRGNTLPQTPTARLFVNRDNYLYVQIETDTVAMVEKVDIHYAFGEYNRRYRNWRRSFAASVSNEGDYIANIMNSTTEGPVFVYATVSYLNGVEFSSVVSHLDMGENKVKAITAPSGHIVVQGNSALKEFCVDSPVDILLGDEKHEVVSELGIKGVCSSLGGLLTFSIGDVAKNMDTELLQIDFYTEKSCEVCVVVENIDEDVETDYSAVFFVRGSKQYFSPIRLTVGDFKNEALLALESWAGVKSIKIVTPNVGVGNIIFV